MNINYHKEANMAESEIKDPQRLRFLEALSYRFPSIAKASTEIINLSSILQLPKETEHFLTDIHGEYEQFNHIMKNASGAVKEKIDKVFGFELSNEDKKELATLIYYPEEKIKLVTDSGQDMHEWYRVMLQRLIRMARKAGSKYTRSKVRRTIDPDFAYIIEELMSEAESPDKKKYYDEILEAIIRTGRAEECISAFANTIQRLCVNRLHIIGDVFDRGPGPDLVMDTLIETRHVDFQWGNHDVIWLGAACGNRCCIATVLRLTVRYGNLDIIEDHYGINLIPLLRLAMKYYSNTDCSVFKIKYDKDYYDLSALPLDMMMHKAIAVLQFKLEGTVIRRHPEYHMDDRLLLDKINYEDKTVTINGETYPMLDCDFPTIDPKDPYRLNEDEAIVIEKLRTEFINCHKLQKHARFLISKGSLYLIYNSTLMYHGSIPMNEDGSFREVQVGSKTYKGRALLDKLDGCVRKAYYLEPGPERDRASDTMWYLWTHEASPLFGKKKMATFERYFIADKKTHEEPKSPYYTHYNNEDIINSIFLEFGLDPENSQIINGHVPVKQKIGETPVKCGGKLFIIDGGFSRAYQSTTGIAGYTLISDSYGFRLVYHDPFTSREDAIRTGSDIKSSMFIEKKSNRRLAVADTDTGARIRAQIAELEELLQAYRDGDIRELE
jgi:fructose-1,6-bisphosphatase-3